MEYVRWIDDVNNRGWSIRVERGIGKVRRREHVAFLGSYTEKWIVGISAMEEVRRYFQGRQVKLMGKNLWNDSIYARASDSSDLCERRRSFYDI